MPSLIPGYAYDIFISYRHNDNRSGWVTDFVRSLQEELAATIKEPVSVYFDTNPHDGLLETHSVDKSLEGKLKCLIFIPILSQTYCDPRSFAWQHEFLAFNKIVSNDPLGRDIRLSNGNVASRILPVRIHELEAGDKVILENELGSVLRSVGFIFSSAGVNRPLTPSDNAEKNLGKTNYRDQINKLANAIKEITSALKNVETTAIPSGSVRASSRPNAPFIKPRTQKLLAFTSLATLLVLLVGYFVFNKTSLGDRFRALSPDKSIAVMPFRNIGKDDNEEYFSDGMTEEVINYLAKVGELKVISRTSIEQYKGHDKDIRTVAHELGVSYILEGSVRRAGNMLRVSVQLIQAETGFHLWSNEYDKEMTNVLQVQSDISREVTEALKIVLTESERKNFENSGSVELTAYDFYLQARSELMNFRNAGPAKGLSHATNAINLFAQSLKADSKFARAYTGLGLAMYYKGNYGIYVNKELIDSAKALADKALQLDGNTDEAYYIRGKYYVNEGKNEEAIVEFSKALAINPNYGDALMGLGLININTNEDYVTGLSQMEHAIQLGRGPELVSNLREIGFAYDGLGLSNKSLEYYKSAARLDGDSSTLLWIKAHAKRSKGELESCLKLIDEAIRLDSTNWFYGDEKAWLLARMGRHKEALDFRLHWEYTHSRHPTTATHRIGYLYWQLGDKPTGLDYFRRMLEFGEESIRLNRPIAQWKFSHYDIAGVFAFLGEKEKAYSYLDVVNTRKFIPYWLLRILQEDPLFDSLRQEERFKKIERDMEEKCQAERNRVSQWLMNKEMKTKVATRSR